MRWLKQIRIEEDGIKLAAGINAVFAISRGQAGETHNVESTSNVGVIQDSRRAGDAREQPPIDPKERR